MHPGLIGAIAGATIAVMGGAVGAYCSVKNATKPRERALMLRWAGISGVWMAALLAWLFLMPWGWGQAACLVLVLPYQLSIPWFNRRAALARALDEAGARAGRDDP